MRWAPDTCRCIFEGQMQIVTCRIHQGIGLSTVQKENKTINMSLQADDPDTQARIKNEMKDTT